MSTSPDRPAVETARCGWCGAAAERDAATQLGWTYAVESGTPRWYCDRCSREHLRSIEGRLDPQWWA